MKKLIQWLAKVFNANITKEVIVEKEVEKIVYKDRIVEVPVEVIKEVIKEVEVIFLHHYFLLLWSELLNSY